MLAAQATFSFRLRVLLKSILQPFYCLARNPCLCCASHILLPTSILQPFYGIARKPFVCCASHILLPTSCFTEIHLTAPRLPYSESMCLLRKPHAPSDFVFYYVKHLAATPTTHFCCAKNSFSEYERFLSPCVFFESHIILRHRAFAAQATLVCESRTPTPTTHFCCAKNSFSEYARFLSPCVFFESHIILRLRAFAAQATLVCESRTHTPTTHFCCAKVLV